MSRPKIAPGCLLLALAACDDGSEPPASVTPASPGWRVELPTTGGGAELLVAELLASADALVDSPLRAGLPVQDAGLRAVLEAQVFDHLRSTGYGAGAGPSLVGSQRIARLALDPAAPPDRNENGTNRDEVLEAESGRIAAFAGATAVPGSWQMLFPFATSSADLQGPLPPAATSSPSSWRTQDLGDRTVRLADVGGALLARVRAAGFLLQHSRGSLAGASAESGRFALDLLHQAIAAEETLLGTLFTDGGPFRDIGDPLAYDPANGALWLPAAIKADLDTVVVGAIEGYRPLDSASELTALARLLHAAAEMAWLSADANPYPNLRDVFRGYPFGSPGGPRPPRGLSRIGGSLSWDRDIGPLLRLRCGGCHLGTFGEGGFLVNTLATVHNGSPRTRLLGHTMIVPGDPDNSFLRMVLVGPPPPFRQMPLLAPLPASEIQLVTDWIRAGAPEHPTSIPEPPQPGAALAQVLFRNLIALHLDRGTGFLQHRNEGGAGSQHAGAVSTGTGLQALAALALAMPDLVYDGTRAVDALAIAAQRAILLLDAEGTASAGEDLAGGVLAEPAGLAGQAALAAGLLAAAPLLPNNPEVAAAAQRCAERFVVAHCQNPDGLLLLQPGYPATRVDAVVVADATAALRLAAGAGVTGAEAARDHVVSGLRSHWIFAEWDGHGEVLDDGNPDTDGDGIAEPAAAGGAHGRLPVFAAQLHAGSEDQLPPPVDVATWSGHVRPLFEQKCGECHLHGAAQGNYRLDTIALLRTPGESGGVMPLLVPGDPEASLLWRKIADRAPPVGVQMPQQRPPLDNKAKEIVRRWILAGASGR